MARTACADDSLVRVSPQRAAGSAVLTSLTLAWALSCTARYPDDKYPCRTVSECKSLSAEFRACVKPHSEAMGVCTRRGSEAAGVSSRDASTREGGQGRATPQSAHDAGRVEEAGPARPDDSATGERNSGGTSSPARPEGKADAGPSWVEFRVESSAPADREQLEELDAPIVVRFSAPVDRESLTADAVSVRATPRWDDTDSTQAKLVAGEMKLSEDRRELTFLPEREWHVSLKYQLELRGIASGDQTLERAAIRFSTRAPVWPAAPEQVVSPIPDERLSGLQLAVAPSGHAYVAWNYSRAGQIGVDYVIRQREPDADSWSELYKASQTQLAELVALDVGGVAYYTYQSSPMAPPMPTARCSDAPGVSRVLTVSDVGVTLLTLSLLSGPDGIYILSYGSVHVFARCDAQRTSYVNELVGLGDAQRGDMAFNQARSVVWAQRDRVDAGGYLASGLWGQHAGSCTSPDCPALLSTNRGQLVDAPSMSWSVVAWRESSADDERSALFARTTRELPNGQSSQWGDAEALSNRVQAVSAPSLAPTSKPSAAMPYTLAVWAERRGGMEQVFGRYHDGEAWSQPQALSEPVPEYANGEQLAQPEVVIDPSGAGMAAWPQAGDGTGSSNLRVVPFVPGEGFRVDQRKLISYAHKAGESPFELGVDEAGHVWLLWLEAGSIWSMRTH